MAQSQHWQWIPTYLNLTQFTQFVLPHLIIGARGPAPNLSLHAIFNYLLVAGFGMNGDADMRSGAVCNN